jgi:hypothetical protein
MIGTRSGGSTARERTNTLQQSLSMSPSAAERMLASSVYAPFHASRSEVDRAQPAGVCPGFSYKPRQMLRDLQGCGSEDRPSFFLPNIRKSNGTNTAAVHVAATARSVAHSSGAQEIQPTEVMKLTKARTRRRARPLVRAPLPRWIALCGVREVRAKRLRRQRKPPVVALRHVARRHCVFLQTERVMHAQSIASALTCWSCIEPMSCEFPSSFLNGELNGLLSPAGTLTR